MIPNIKTKARKATKKVVSKNVIIFASLTFVDHPERNLYYIGITR